MKVQPKITMPTTELIAQASDVFDSEAHAAEESIKLLFTTYPKNNDFNSVLWKVIVLNRIYSTQVFAVEDLARHIVSHSDQLDKLLKSGSPEAVDLFAEVMLGNKKRNLFSFASKYCSWHNQNAFPIFDSRVGWYLWNLQKQTPFSGSFKKYEFQNYEEFKRIVFDFQQHFHLEGYDFKGIDKFLWLYGEPNVSASDANNNESEHDTFSAEEIRRMEMDPKWNNNDLSESIAEALLKRKV